MPIDVSAYAEWEAYHLLQRAGDILMTTDPLVSIHEAADRIIALAEKIKAQRATLAMQAAGQL